MELDVQAKQHEWTLRWSGGAEWMARKRMPRTCPRIHSCATWQVTQALPYPPHPRRAPGLAECSVLRILQFLIILSLNLCFASDIHGTTEHDMSRDTCDMHVHRTLPLCSHLSCLMPVGTEFQWTRNAGEYMAGVLPMTEESGGAPTASRVHTFCLNKRAERRQWLCKNP